jgi:CDP-diacylglycerol pyrophosphatase
MYRGYYSRKYVHDFSARRMYMEHIEAKNQKMRESLQQYNDNMQKYDIAMAEELEKREFTLMASKLHYLTSTKAIPGVFKELEAVSDFGKTPAATA